MEFNFIELFLIFVLFVFIVSSNPSLVHYFMYDTVGKIIFILIIVWFSLKSLLVGVLSVLFVIGMSFITEKKPMVEGLNSISDTVVNSTNKKSGKTETVDDKIKVEDNLRKSKQSSKIALHSMMKNTNTKEVEPFENIFSFSSFDSSMA